MGAVLIVLVPTGSACSCEALGGSVPTIDAAMLYLLAVVVAAARFRRGPAVAAALVGIASFDFFFVHPFYTFSVSDVRYVLTFGVMLLVALVLGGLTGRIRDQAEAAREREQRTAALYALSRELASAQRARRGARRHGPQHRRTPSRSRRPSSFPEPRAGSRPSPPRPYALDERERAVAQWSHRPRPGSGPRHEDPARLPRRMYLPLIAVGSSARCARDSG